MSEQHLDEITIPDIEIDKGWAISEIATTEDCEDAYAFLMAVVAEIEYELELKDLGVCKFADPTWPARARRALKYKKAALQMVSQRRGRIERDRKRQQQGHRDQLLLDHIKASVSPAQFHQWVVSSGVDGLDSEAA